MNNIRNYCKMQRNYFSIEGNTVRIIVSPACTTNFEYFYVPSLNHEFAIL